MRHEWRGQLPVAIPGDHDVSAYSASGPGAEQKQNGSIAAARGIKLNRVESTVEGDIDLRGVLGLSPEVRNGYQDIQVSFEIDGDASPEQLAKIVMQSKARSAVYDILTNGVPVLVAVKTPAIA